MPATSIRTNKRVVTCAGCRAKIKPGEGALHDFYRTFYLCPACEAVSQAVDAARPAIKQIAASLGFDIFRETTLRRALETRGTQAAVVADKLAAYTRQQKMNIYEVIDWIKER